MSEGKTVSLLHALHVHGLHYLKRAATQLKTTDDTDLVNNRKKHEALTVRLQFTERTSECVCHTKHGALTDT